MVRKDSYIADIGTDHAYLPAHLITYGKIKKAIASDIKNMPLENAMKTIKKYGIEDKVLLVKSDGLQNIDHSVCDIILAGMGGILISEILEDAPWLKDPSKRIIAQPMTHAQDVRDFFIKNGFEIICENAVSEPGKIYIAMNARFTGEDYSKYPESFKYIGKLAQCESPMAKEYLKKQCSALKTKAQALKSSSANHSYYDELCNIIMDIERCL
jgi:tRNA (adenine22-N1)-methyltransferase